MNEFIPTIINKGQSGDLKARYIGQNISLLEDINFIFTEFKQIHCILLTINFEKAFD